MKCLWRRTRLGDAAGSSDGAWVRARFAEVLLTAPAIDELTGHAAASRALLEGRKLLPHARRVVATQFVRSAPSRRWHRKFRVW